MSRTVAAGEQSFEEVRINNCFYVDKTEFIREWWNGRKPVILITRPRRFGKTFTLDMIEMFFSIEYAGRSDLFEGLKIWEYPEFRKLQGTIDDVHEQLNELIHNSAYSEDTKGDYIGALSMRLKSHIQVGIPSGEISQWTGSAMTDRKLPVYFK